MLARASSDAGTRLRRSKSTSTVHRHMPPLIEPLDLDVAQKHAIAAATAAFTRSHAQEALERKANRSIELGRSKSTTSRKSLTSQGSHFPPRELNVRSVPAQTSVQTSSLQTSSPHRLSVASAKEKFLLFDLAPLSDRPTPTTRPLSAQPSVTFSDARPVSQPRSHRQSAASSVASQQIRKARSMYYASSVQTGSPIARPPAKFLTTPPPVGVSLASSNAPMAYVPTRSTRPSPLAGPRVTVPTAPNGTIDTARDKVLQDFQQQPRSIKHKPSLFLAPFKKRQDKTKDKAKRLTLTHQSFPSNDYSFAVDTTADITVSDFTPQVEVKDKRSFSGSLKKKIKRVFRRTSAKTPSLPVQQIEASRDYFNDTTVGSTGDHGNIPSPEEHLLRRVRSRTPSLDAVRPHHPISTSRSSSRGSARSDRSLHSEANLSSVSASRVTSWGTSASGETLTQRAIKRLTVIHEAKDSIGSMTDRPLSASTKPRSLPLPTFSAFQDPMHMESLVEEASTPPIEPKRVFSALMREIDASKAAEGPADIERTPGAESDGSDSSKTKGIHTVREVHQSSATTESEPLHGNEQKSATRRPASVAARSVQSKKSTIKSFGHAIRSTIRTVTPGQYRSSPCPEEHATANSDSNTPSSSASSGSRNDLDSRAVLFRRLQISKKKSATFTQDVSVVITTPTATQIEMRVARAKDRWQTPLNESLTPQFPRETDRLYTMADPLQQCPTDPVTAIAGQSSAPASPSVQLSKSMQTPMSPSVYSRNTDGVSIFPNDSVMSFGSPYKSDRTHQGGSAVILTSQSVRSYVIGTPSPSKRPDSTRSSRDWKAWLSHEVSGIEAASQEDITIQQQYASPYWKHKRVTTQTIRTSQTDSDDTAVIARESLEMLTPRAVSGNNAALGTDAQIPQSSSSDLEPCLAESVPEDFSTIVGGSKKLSSDRPPLGDRLPSVPTSTPVPYKERSSSTTCSSPNSTQLPSGTPTSARMNERFPFLVTGRRSSSDKSCRSYLSKSPTSSVGSTSKTSKTPSGSRTIYSTHPMPVTTSSSVNVHIAAARTAESTWRNKENTTPPTNLGAKSPIISPLGVGERPKSLEPLSLAAFNRKSTNLAPLSSKVVDASPPKRAPSVVETVVARPSLRVTIRPLSPEKLSRRPRSAFDLRHTPSPRPASELRRPGLQHEVAKDQSTPDEKTPGDGLLDVNPREGSVMPGQRMAERSLKERKSATVLERGIRKSTGKFVREDTPAFL